MKNKITAFFSIIIVGSYISCALSISSSIEEIDIELFLKERLSNKKVVYVPNEGGAGDVFIWYGTICLFEKLGIKYITTDKEKIITDPKVDVVVYGGGGNLVPYYDHCARFLAKYAHKAKEVILLPATIQGHKKLLAKLPRHVTVFCREHMSYAYCKKVVPFAERVLFARDLAFYSNMERFKNCAENTEHFFAFRNDVETNKSGKKFIVPASNNDLTPVGHIYPSTSHATNISTINKFLTPLAQSKVVWTDRLHTGIAAFLLGKEVHLFDNSYGKIGAVYNATLSNLDTKKKITFHGTNFDAINEFKEKS